MLYVPRSLGMRGRTCLLKAVCEVADEGLPESYGLLGEVTAMLLASSHNVDNSTRSALAQYSEAEHRGRHAGNCNTQYTGCPFHLRDLIHYAVTVLHGDSRRGTWH
ncbi:Protein of unknown function DM4/12 [Trinorchestia longiramus]|nr:Protein of unknown function DM4/12 [Trinorchestia longiramus]